MSKFANDCCRTLAPFAEYKKKRGNEGMRNHLYSIKLTRDMLGEEKQTIKFISSYLSKDKELDKEIKNKFPATYFGDEKELLRIKGSKALMKGFDDLDSEKYDFMAKSKDIKFVG